MTDFYLSSEWRQAKKITFQTYPHFCMRCGSKKELQCAHIKARSLYPRLALKLSNLGILCKGCNLWQGVRTIDYRGIRGLITRGYRMVIKYAVAGVAIGYFIRVYTEDWTWLMAVNEAQYLLYDIQQSLMTTGVM
jgi:hypothetical protein